MIRYQLNCPREHSFDSWFQNSETFTRLLKARQVVCPHCGSNDVHQALTAPAVHGRREALDDDTRKAAILALREQLEANSEYVGLEFVAEARRIHEGTAPERSIYGEARTADAIKLLEDGVQVVPLPFVPPRKVN